MKIIAPANDVDLKVAAELVFVADKGYYRLFRNKAKVIQCLVEMYSDTRTDFSAVKSVYVDGAMVGIMQYYPLGESKIRHMFGLQYLMKIDEFDYKAVERFDDNVPKIKGDGIYLARIAIIKKYQGRGLCSKILSSFERLDDFKSANKIVLHVKKDNTSAIRCYYLSGYNEVNCFKKTDYIVMKKVIRSKDLTEEKKYA